MDTMDLDSLRRAGPWMIQLLLKVAHGLRLVEGAHFSTNILPNDITAIEGNDDLTLNDMAQNQYTYCLVKETLIDAKGSGVYSKLGPAPRAHSERALQTMLGDYW